LHLQTKNCWEISKSAGFRIYVIVQDLQESKRHRLECRTVLSWYREAKTVGFSMATRHPGMTEKAWLHRLSKKGKDHTAQHETRGNPG
jgi:hypothetical protein